MSATLRSTGFQADRHRRPAPSRAVGQGGAPELVLADLFNDFGTLLDLIPTEVAAGHWLDAFLLAAGLHQLVEDNLQGDRRSLHRAAGYLGDRPTAAAQSTAAVADAVIRAELWTRSVRPSGRRRARMADGLGLLARGLCAAALEPGGPSEERAVALGESTAALIRNAGVASQLGTEIIRLPSCFSSFDQHPADVEALMLEVSLRWPQRTRPLTVLGVRTSGSYLAPIGAFSLGRLGYTDITTVTVRPGWPLSAGARVALRRTVAGGGLVLVLDDPPATGTALARVVDTLRQAGVPLDLIVLVYGTFAEGPELHDSLDRVQRVALPWSRWEVQDQLEPATVAAALGRLTGPAAAIGRVERLGAPTRPARGHVKGTYSVETVREGTATTEQMVAEGVGLGYFGRQTVAVATAMPGLVPEVFGLVDGVLYRRWIPEAWRCAGAAGDHVSAAPRIAAHLAERGRVLRVRSDPSQELAGRQPAWEVAASIASGSFGRLAVPLRLPVVDPLVREVLEVAEPCVIDGATELEHWFVRDQELAALKGGFGGGPFSHLDLASYDPVFDLAAVAVCGGDPEFRRVLRAAYESQTGRPVEPERWMLHRLVQLWNARRLNRLCPEAARRLGAQILQSYLAERYLDDIDRCDDGPFCALDLDGVLETSPLGFPATTAAGALALRALLVHGYRPLVVTGRSLPEVVDRCAAYGLAGGVAEYGAVAYDHRHGRTVDLLPDGAAHHLSRLRLVASAETDLGIDHGFERVVRIWQSRSDRSRELRRHGLDPEQAARLQRSSATGSDLVAVAGEEQTDFVPAGVDKGRGLATLLELLGESPGQRGNGHPPLALAVGDSGPDAPFLAMARLALAPANADAALRRAGTETMSRPYQAGVAQAVGRLIGHRPGSCRKCRPHLPPGPARDLIMLLSFQESHWRSAPFRLLRLGSRGMIRRVRR